MSLGDQQKRYMRLTGEPLHTSFTRAALCGPMAKSAGLSVLFNLATVTGGNATNIAASLTGSALAYTVLYGLFKGLEHFQLKYHFDGKGDMLCIDTTPQENTPPTKARYKDFAEEICDSEKPHLMFGGLGLALSSIVDLAVASIPDLTVPPNLVLYLSTGGTLAFSLTGHCAHSFIRFKKVVSDEWVITDTPAPEPKEEKAVKPAWKPT